MDSEAPVVKLVNAILLVALKKHATRIFVAHESVELEIDGAVHLEMKPPARLHGFIIRRLSVMASLPVYGKGMAAFGRIQLRIGETREATFEIEVAGHGDAAAAVLRVVSDTT